MPDIQTIWVGGPPPDWAKQGLLNIQQQYPKQSPDEQRNFWVHPSRIGPNNTGDETLRQMREAAEAAGFEVKIIADHLDEFAENMSRYNGDTLRDVIKWEMGNKGEIAVKDLTNYMVLGKYGGLSLDLSTQPTAADQGSSNVTTTNDLRSLHGAEFKVPKLADDSVARQIGNPSYSQYSQNPANQAEIHSLPHLDVWAMYARPGESKGQEVMRGAAEKMIGNYADLVNTGIDRGQIVTRPGQGGEYERNRFNLAVVGMDTELGAKWNPGEQHRQTVIGHFAMSSLYDSIHGVYGNPTTPTHESELVRVEVPKATWDSITWPTVKTPAGTEVPDLGITKQYQNSWRQANDEAVTRAMVSTMRLSTEPHPPGYTTPPRGASTQSSPTLSAAASPPQSPSAGRSNSM